MKRIALNRDWKLWQVSGEETKGQIFTIDMLPCQVEDVLIREGIVENPNLHGHNMDRWIGKNDWCYEKHFFLEETAGNFHLVLGGLDTFADILLNGHLLAHNESAYMPCRIENVSGLQKGENVLRLYSGHHGRFWNRSGFPENSKSWCRISAGHVCSAPGSMSFPVRCRIWSG